MLHSVAGKALLDAVLFGDVLTVQHSVAQPDFDMNCRDYNGATLLHHAAKGNQIECLQLLLSHGADIRQQDRGGKTVFHVTAELGLVEVLTALEDQCREDEESWGIFMEALTIGENEEGDFTALHSACRHGQSLFAKALIRIQPALINQLDCYGRTALSVSISERKDSSLCVWMVGEGAKNLLATLELEPLEASYIEPSPLASLAYSDKDLKRLFNNPEESDVQFNVEGTIMFANRDVLSTSTEFFGAMLSPRWSQEETEIVVRDTTPAAFLSLLNWIYTRQISIDDPSELLELWQLAHTYNIRLLHRVVQQKIVDILMERRHDFEGVDSVSFLKYIKDLFEDAYLRNARYLNRFCSSYLLDHLDSFLNDAVCFSEQEAPKKEKYVEWLFQAVDDVYDEEFLSLVFTLSDKMVKATSSKESGEEGEPDAQKDHASTMYEQAIGSIMSTFQSLSGFIYGSSTFPQTPDVSDDCVIFRLTRVNWYGREQKRGLTIRGEDLLRIDPATNKIRGAHKLSDITKIHRPNYKDLVLTINKAKDYYQGEQVEEFMQALIEAAPHAEVEIAELVKEHAVVRVKV